MTETLEEERTATTHDFRYLYGSILLLQDAFVMLCGRIITTPDAREEVINVITDIGATAPPDHSIPGIREGYSSCANEIVGKLKADLTS